MHSISRSDLINQSDFIFIGWPSPNKSSNNCSTTFAKFQVHKVFKGNKSFEGKIISIAAKNYKLMENIPNGSKGPSFAQIIYGDGNFNFEQSSSIIFANINADGCVELSAVGAQEHRFKEKEIEAITSNNCESVINVIDQYLESLPKNCEVDSDCVLKNFHADTCKDLKVYNKDADKKLDDNFSSLKTAFYSSCQNYLNTRGACAPPQKPPFFCKNKVCTIGVSPEKITSLVNFKKAQMHSSCAPHDAGSHMIVLKNTSSDFPYFSLNWWGKFQPSNLLGTYELAKANQNDYNHNFCLAEGVCEDLKSLKVKVKIDPKSKNFIEYDFETRDGKKLNGNLELTIDNSHREMCG